MIQPSMPEANHNAKCGADSGSVDGASPSSWRHVLKNAVRDVDTLADMLELPREAMQEIVDRAPDFALIVPRGFVARMRKGDVNDPLLRQVLPLGVEHSDSPGYTRDPLGERRLGTSGVIQKYPGRVLLIATGACPIHCRYCFRRHFPYSSQLAARRQWQGALERLRGTPHVEEVILSGGDPLSLPNSSLGRLLGELEAIEHIRCVRIHTRFPIVIPERIDRELLELLASAKVKIVFVLHTNHAAEIDADVEAALRLLARSSNALLNQSVLLRGINDSADELCRLSRRLFAADVLPYYLHLLDRVRGTQHFEVPDIQASNLIDEMRQMLPGYLVPKLVRETPGELSKVAVV